MGLPTVSPLGSAGSRLTATRVAAILQNLLLYDEIWTAEVNAAQAQPGPVPLAELGGIRDLVGQMKEELDALRGPLGELRSMVVDSEPGTLEGALNALVSAGVVPAGAAAELRSGLQVDLQAAFVDAADYILENSSGEAHALDEQLKALEGGEAFGDFPDKFWCAAIVASAGAVVAGTVVIGGAVLGVGLLVGGTVVSGAAAMHFAKCFDGLPKFRFGFGH